MTDLGEIAWILGIHVTWNREAGRIELSQQGYIEEILKRFGKSDVCPTNTPTLTNKHVTKLSSPEVDIKSYQRAFSARPDLAYAMGALGRHAAATPREEHQRALDWVFRYLQATKDWRLVFQRGTPDGLTLTGFVDANWANNLSDCKSTSGYVYKLTGGASSLSSKKQSSVTLSSTSDGSRINCWGPRRKEGHVVTMPTW